MGTGRDGGGGTWRTPGGRGGRQSGGRALAEPGSWCLCPALGAAGGAASGHGDERTLGLEEVTDQGSRPRAGTTVRPPFSSLGKNPSPALALGPRGGPKPEPASAAPSPFSTRILTLGLGGGKDGRLEGDPTTSAGRKWAGPGWPGTGAALAEVSDWFAQSRALSPRASSAERAERPRRQFPERCRLRISLFPRY